jgi:hypothetical protein
MSSTCNMLAAGRCWCLSVMNSSIMVHLAQAGSLDVLVFVGEVGVQARLHTNCILLHEEMWRAWSSELSSASSRSFHWCADRRRRLRVAGVSGDSRRAVLRCGAAWPSGARAGLLCITACLHLNPSMALTSALAYSFRLHEAAAVVESGGDAGAEWRPVGDPQREPCVGHV